MENLNFRYVKAQALIVIVAIFAAALFAVNKWVSNHWGVSFSVFAILGFLFGIINSYLWNIRPCAWMYNVPDFTGRYEGTLKYEYRDEKCELRSDTLEHVKVIKQNGSNVVVRSFTKKKDGSFSSESISKEASIIKEPDGSYSLLYNYLNEGDSEQGFSPHYGTETLKLIIKVEGKYLIGRYYTERLPHGTKGKIDVKFKNKDLTHEK
ncbi:MAG: Cap15 family cyclic dinucleotide receptor domain-containing protein [Bacteroidia bacterium]